MDGLSTKRTDNKKAMLSQGGPRYAAVIFITSRKLQWHRAVSLR